MSWSEIHIDALAEMMNLGVGHAAALLSEMISDEIELSVPSVTFMGEEDLKKLIAGEMPGGAVSIRQTFSGDMSGAASLFFLEESSAPLVRMLLDDSLTVEDVLELEAEALSELGNIIINGCLGTVANQLGTTLAIDLPEFSKGFAHITFGDKQSEGPNSILVRIRLNSHPTGIGGLIVLFMDGQSQLRLKTMLDQLIEQVC